MQEGASLADRPRSVVGGEILSGNVRILLVGNGDRLCRFCRYESMRRQSSCFLVRSSMRIFGPMYVATTYESLQSQHVKNFVLDILGDPANHQKHVKW